MRDEPDSTRRTQDDDFSPSLGAVVWILMLPLAVSLLLWLTG